jgi:5-methylcytosine-specific restriction protein A
MPSVFVYSAGQTAAAHFQRTIQTGVPLSLFQPIIPPAVYATLQEAYPDGVCYLWGDRGGENGRQYWQHIRPGDLALCYRKKRIVAASTVVATLENEAAGIAAWPDAASDPYRLLFFLSQPVWTDVAVESMPQYFGKVYQGLRRLRSSDNIITDFGSLDQFVRVALLSNGGNGSATALERPPRVVHSQDSGDSTGEGEPTPTSALRAATPPAGAKHRNPTWSRDELILALDLYFRVDLSRVASDDPAIVALSDLLNRLQLHNSSRRNALYRNPNGVRMKLMNFLRFDPNYSGEGLSRGGKLEQQVWEEFSADQSALEQAARSIAEAVDYLDGNNRTAEPDDSDAFMEGGVLEVIHRRRERSRKLVDRKKNAVLAEHGCLRCEVCGFDFAHAYGELGRGFAECHHRSPLSEVAQARATRLTDLAIVCANCHRMLHRRRPWLTIEELASLI